MFEKLSIIGFYLILFLCFETGFSKYEKGNSNGLITTNEKTEEFGEYGIDWVYFPDGNGNIKLGFLRHPKYYKKNFSTRTIFSDDSEPEQVVKFIFYNRKNNEKGGTTFSLRNVSAIINEIDNRKPLKLVTHGWLSNGYSNTCQTIKNSYLKRDAINVIVMDWSAISDTVWYYKPLTRTKDVAFYYSKIVKELISNGMDPKNIHFVGHSLGAHVSGFAAGFLNGSTGSKVGRITGLDPALPGFIYLTERLTRNNAHFVDVIHTCGGFLGILSQIGHVDFYPNGGTPPQPGCSGVDEVIRACSHGQSWMLFEESIASSQFEAYKCDSWDDFQLGICIREKILFGEPVDTTARGSYYFNSTKKIILKK